MKISIIVPVYNEARTIGEALRQIHAVDLGAWDKEIIAVDDGSNDDSKREAQSAKQHLKAQNITILSHEVNRGKGAAIRTGLAVAGGDAVVIQDADLEYDPRDIPSMLDAFERAGKRAVIYGSRELTPERRGYTHYVWGVRVLTGIANILFGSRLTDIYTGFKLFPTPLIRSLRLGAAGFEFEAEVTAKLLRRGIGIREVPVHYFPRSFAEGKKIRVRDGVVGLWMLLKCRVI